MTWPLREKTKSWPQSLFTPTALQTRVRKAARAGNRPKAQLLGYEELELRPMET